MAAVDVDVVVDLNAVVVTVVFPDDRRIAFAWSLP
jgi:hypothetical protein